MIYINCIIPFKEKIEFETDIYEIESISLEHETTKNEMELLGNFTIFGTYKESEYSNEILDFKYVIPFSLEFANKVNVNTVNFYVDNFTYDINKNIMDVNIDYIVDAKEEVREPLEDNLFDLIEDNINNEEIKNEVFDNISSFNLEEEYITYHVHQVKENDSIESICEIYKVNKIDILKINDLKEIHLNDRILIPLSDE